jgi:hypothetical protein
MLVGFNLSVEVFQITDHFLVLMEKGWERDTKALAKPFDGGFFEADPSI